jgi:integral membrane protein
MKPKALFNLFAKSEAVTWTLLISALIARSFGIDSLVVTFAGGIHGAVFLGYAVTAALVGVNQRWGFGKTALGIFLAIIPFATLPFEASLKKTKSLEGAWRTQKSEDKRDDNWFDGLFRWFIARPIILIVVLVTFVVALFSFLLWLGPPDQWFE